MHSIKARYILWIVLLLSKLSAAQIAADFTSADSVGCDALIVDFSNTSAGEETISYQWDFGNGNTSTLANPQVVFNTVGKYTITLIAYNENYADTLIKPDYIIVNKSPIITNLSVIDPINCVPLTTPFEGVIDTGTTSIDKYIWDFGDGNTSLEPLPTHTYDDSGTFTVSLFIIDDNNCKANYTIANLIQAVPLPVIVFSSLNNIACNDTLSVQLENTSYGASSLSFQWDFGNGLTSIEESPINTYIGYGEYNVTLSATDTFACTSSLTKANYVKMKVLTINTTLADDFLCKQEKLQVSNETQGANKHFWDFGDGTTSSAVIPDKSYNDTGTFIITYVALLDNYCSDTLFNEVTVDKATAHFSVDNNYGCQYPFNVQYTNTSVGADKWSWKFGNSTGSIAENPSIDYAITPTLKETRNIYFSDTLIVESDQQCRDTFIIDSNIHLYLPKVYFTPNASSTDGDLFKGCVPIEINFVNKSESYNKEDPFVDILWDFGDSNTSTDDKPTYKFTEAGDYPITLSVTNQSGCVNTYSSDLLAGSLQEALFSYDSSSIVCGSEQILFNNLSTNDSLVDAWEWLFSEGSKFYEKSPEFQSKDTGFISGELTVFYNGCQGSTFSLDSFIYIDGPAGELTLGMDCDEPLTYQLNFEINGVEGWTYDLGDGTTGSALEPQITHTYAESGNYDVVIEANNAECNLLIERKVFVRQLENNFIIEPLDICPASMVTFNPENTVGNSIFVYENEVAKYLWNFGDTITDFSWGTTNHSYTEPGIYSVNLLVKDINGCEQSLQKDLKVLSVQSEFSYSDSIGCAPLSVTFSDHTVSDTTLSAWYWDFGNGENSTEQNPKVSFEEDKSHNISLIVSDVAGCVDTLIKENAIFSSKPSPDFQLPNTETCLNDSIHFENISQGEKLYDYLWTFGVDMTSKELNPIIVLPDTGYFDVTLWVNDSVGCDTQIIKPNYVYVQSNPIADFTLDGFSSVCYPKVIGFNDISTSEDIGSRYWEFGDGEIILNNKEPFHTYHRPGLFDVSLKVTTSKGCFDVMTKEDVVDIGGPYVNIVTPDTLCVNLPVSISFNDSLNINYFQWSLEDGSTYDNSSFSVTYDDFGVKKVYINLKSDTLGTCNKLIVDSINIPILTADFIVSDPALCSPFNSLTSNTSIQGNSYEWYVGNEFVSNESEPSIFIQEAGLHDIKMVAKSITACRDSIVKQATVFALPDIKLNNDTLICQNDSIWLHANDGIDYAWFVENQLFDSFVSSVLVKPMETSRYHVKVSDENACINYDSTVVSVKPKPRVSIITPDSLIIIGEQIELQALHEDTDEISWEPFDEVNCSNCISTEVRPLESTMFYFMGADDLGCFSVFDSVFVSVDAKYSVDVPTSFTPNGDGINDFIYVMGWGIKELSFFTIYDLHGRVVFTSNDIHQGWDGNSSLGMQQEGMFLYNVEVSSFDNVKRSKQGSFYLIR